MNKNEAIEYLVTKVHDQDEPLFILRGRDVLATEILFRWILEAGINKVDEKKIHQAQRVLDDFAMFTPKRLPD